MTATVPTQHPARFTARWLGEVFALAALYFLTARLGLLMALPGGHVTPVWPPSGIALAAVLLRGQRVWPGIWLGSFAANILDFYSGTLGLATALGTSATFGIGASLTAVLGCHLLRRFVGERNPLEQVLDVCAFMALGGVVSCLVSATIGVTTLCLAGYAAWSSYSEVWLTWWLGDTGGVFIVAPLLLVWGGRHRRKLAGRWVELFGGMGLTLAVTYYVFCKNTTASSTGKPLTFVILIPFLVWAAVRFGRRGAATASGLIALLAVWGTIHQTGPFNVGPRNEALLLLELFLGVMALTALCLAAIVTDHVHVAAAQQRAVEELESHVRERTSAVVQSEAEVRQHLAEATRARTALLSILEDQQQAEAALRESETRMQLLVKSANIGLWDWDLLTNDIFFSPEWKSQLGYTDDELPGRYEEWESRLHPEDRAEALRAVQCFREGRCGDYEIEFRLRHKDGSWRSILTHADLLRDPSGQPVRMMGCHIDITARKQAEEKLRESETRFRELAENINDVFWISDLWGSNTIYISPAYERIWGRSCESLYSTPRSWRDDIHPEDRRRMEMAFASTLAAPSDYTYRIVRPDGSIRWIRDRGFPVCDESGRLVRFAGIAQDITESKQVEEQLQKANQQLHVLSRRLFDVQEHERRHLARELHDEIGQALTAVKINLESVSPKEEDSFRLRETITMLDNLLRQVRQISIDLHPSLLDDLGLAPALRSLLDQQVRRAGLRAQFYAAESLDNIDPAIKTAGFRITQEAITNVLRHAKARVIGVRLYTKAGHLHIRIADDGIGLDMAQLERRVRRAGGFGLIGMRERAALVAGRVRVTSSPNKGTIVKVSLPLHASTRTSQSYEGEDSLPRKGSRNRNDDRVASKS